MFSPFEIHTEAPNLTRVYIGRKSTVWFSHSKVIAFAVSGYATVKLDGEVETAATKRHLAKIPALTISAEEFNARLALLGRGMDDEAANLIQRPSWENKDLAIKLGTDLITKGL